MDDPARPLAGIRVLDLTTFLSGPIAARALADLGADVVRVEPPRGDPTRAGTGLTAGDPPSSFYLALHRDRRAIVLDLKTEAGGAVGRDLAAACDVLLENFRPGVTDRLGITEAALRPRNPGLVYCTITGFGPDGPHSQLPATDGAVQAFGGVLELTGPPGGFGLPVPLPLADLLAGATAAQGILAALVARARHGRGTHLDVSMLESLLGWLLVADRERTLAPPTTLVVKGSDGEAILVQTSLHFQDRLAGLLAPVPGCSALTGDPRFATRAARQEHLDEYTALVERAFASRPSAAWLDALGAIGIPAARVQGIDDALTHPQLEYRARDRRGRRPRPRPPDGARRPVPLRRATQDRHQPAAHARRAHPRRPDQRLGLRRRPRRRARPSGRVRRPAPLMRALRVHEYGEPTAALTLEDVTPPVPGPAQVAIRVGAATLGLPDVLLGRGRYQLRPPLPFTPGLEAAGSVVAVGPGVDPARVGDRVVGVPTLPDGALAEVAVLPADGAYPLPDDVDDVAAAATHIAHTTAHLGLHRRAGLQAGQTLLVHAGAGGTGSAAIQLGVLAGARVLATAGTEDRLAVCRELGAVLTISAREDDVAATVRDATGGRGADVIFDPVGGDAFRASQRCVASEGTILVVGFAGGEIQDIAANRVLLGNYSVVGLYVGAYSTGDANRVRRDVHDELMVLLGAGTLRPLVSSQIGLDAAPRALEALRDRQVVGRVVVRPGAPTHAA